METPTAPAEAPAAPPASLRLLRACTRRLYRVRGAARVAEAVRKSWVRRGGDYWIDDFDGALRFRVDLAEHMTSQIFWRGAYSENELAALAGRLAPDATFVDVGANVGEFTLFAARRCARVYAFEPSAELYARLAAHVRANALAHVTPVRAALADREGESALAAPEARWTDGSRHAGLGSIFPGADGAGLSRQRVPVTTLDAFVAAERPARIDVVKIDVEGAERAVLAGGAATIARFRPDVLIELNPVTSERAGYTVGDLLSWLAERGYRRFGIGPGGRLVPRDVHDATAFENALFAADDRP